MDCHLVIHPSRNRGIDVVSAPEGKLNRSAHKTTQGLLIKNHFALLILCFVYFPSDQSLSAFFPPPSPGLHSFDRDPIRTQENEGEKQNLLDVDFIFLG